MKNSPDFLCGWILSLFSSLKLHFPHSIELRELEQKLKAAYMNKERAAQIAERDAIKYEQMVKLLRVCAVVLALCWGQVLRAGPLRRPWEISTELSGPGNPHVHCSWTCYDKLTRYNCLYPSMWLRCSPQLYVWVLLLGGSVQKLSCWRSPPFSRLLFPSPILTLVF